MIISDEVHRNDCADMHSLQSPEMPEAVPPSAILIWSVWRGLCRRPRGERPLAGPFACQRASQPAHIFPRPARTPPRGVTTIKSASAALSQASKVKGAATERRRLAKDSASPSLAPPVPLPVSSSSSSSTSPYASDLVSSVMSPEGEVM